LLISDDKYTAKNYISNKILDNFLKKYFFIFKFF